jgi:hypothetical protein
LQFLRRINLIEPKRAPFYPLAPGLGKLAAMLFLKAGCGEPAVFAALMAPAARGGRGPVLLCMGLFSRFYVQASGAPPGFFRRCP